MNTIKKGSRGTDVKILQTKLNLIADGIFGPLTEEAVKEFQRAKGLSADGIVGPKTWAAIGIMATSNPRNITEIIVHCTATPEGEDFSVAQIRAAHLARGFSDIGYHYLIGRDGTIYKGRDEAIAGAHCPGHNSNSIGICYVGGCPPRTVANWMNKWKDTRTDAQKSSLIKLLKELKAEYPKATIHGHNEFANKACPSFTVKTEYNGI